MDKDFVDLIKRMAQEQGKEVLTNGKAKTYLTDYCEGRFKKEANIFRQILDAGCGEHINNADNVPERKQKLMKRLEDDNGLSPKITVEYLNLLGYILRGDTSKCGEAVSVPSTSPSAHINIPVPTTAPLAGGATMNIPSGNMAWLNGGTFTMGSPTNEQGRIDSEGLQHQVTVSGFYMGRYTITVDEFRHFVEDSGYRTDAEKSGGEIWIGSKWKKKSDANWKNPYFNQGDNHPVVLVSWFDAVQYSNWLSGQEGLTPAYNVNWINVTWNQNANGYRLPTEAEWEYACRAGTTTAYNTGASINDKIGWYSANSGNKTHPVGQKPANAWGLYDMHGNVMEWCWDRYGEYSIDTQTDPKGARLGSERVIRGGSWHRDAQYLRSALRNVRTPSFRGNDLGFRLVRT